MGEASVEDDGVIPVPGSGFPPRSWWTLAATLATGIALVGEIALLEGATEVVKAFEFIPRHQSGDEILVV